MNAKPIPYGRQYTTDEDVQTGIETRKSADVSPGPKQLDLDKAVDA